MEKVFKNLALYLILSISIVSAQPLRNNSLAIQHPTNSSETPIIRVLAIGNSFSEDAIEQNLYELAKEAGIELIIGDAYRAGQGFKSHWDDVINNNNTFQYRKIVNGTNKNTMNQSLSSIITNEPWDFITFQQVSQESGLTNTFEPYLGNLIDYVKSLSTNNEVKFGYHMTWAYAQNSTHSGFANYSNNQMMMYEAIVSAVQKALSDHTELSFIIPSGTAIQNARTSYFGDNFNRDGYHLNYGIGRYTAACTWLEAVLGVNPVGKAFRPSEVDEITASVCQNAAHLAVQNPYIISDMSNEIFEDNNTIVPSTIKINFGDLPSSSTMWNNITSSKTYFEGLKDVDGKDSRIIAVLNDAFNGTNGLGASATTTSLDMPEEVSESCFWGYCQGNFENKPQQPSGGFAFFNMNKELAYDFTFYASRIGSTDNRETIYCLSGKDTLMGVLDAANNINNTVTLSDVRPDSNGIITLSISPGENNTNAYKFYYINAAQITAHSAIDSDDGIKKTTLDPIGSSEKLPSAIYNLHGQRLHTSQQGINIVNRRRILVK